MKRKALKLIKFSTLPIATQWLIEAFSSKRWMSEKDMSIPMNFRSMPKNLQQAEFEKWVEKLEKKGAITFFLKNSKGDKVRFTIFNKSEKVPFITAKVEPQDEADSFYREVIYGEKVAENYWGALVG